MAAFLTLFITLNSTAFVIAKAEEAPTFSFKYIDIETGEELGKGEPLFEGRSYEFKAVVSGFSHLANTTLPIHFDNDIIELITYDGETAPEAGFSWPLIQYDAEDYNVLYIDYDTIDSYWSGGEAVYNSRFPYLSNDEEIIKISFVNNSNKATKRDIALFSFCF